MTLAVLDSEGKVIEKYMCTTIEIDFEEREIKCEHKMDVVTVINFIGPCAGGIVVIRQ